MIYSLKGKIVDSGTDWVAIDLGAIAYEVYLAHPEELPLGSETTLYVHEVITQDDHYLAGFLTKVEKDAFIALCSVKGIGPKTAISALSGTTPEELFKAIESSNTSFLKKLPGIGPKAASQIILDLKGKLVSAPAKGDARYDEVRSALRNLGFKSKDVDDVLASISIPGGKDEEILREALRKLGKK